MDHPPFDPEATNAKLAMLGVAWVLGSMVAVCLFSQAMQKRLQEGAPDKERGR